MKRFLISVISILVLGSASISAQSLSLGITGGPTFIQKPDVYKNDINELGSNLGFKSNYHIGAKLKLGFPVIPLKFNGQIVYTSFKGTKEGLYTGWMEIPSTVSAVKMETSTSLLTLSAGAEYMLIPGPIAPYLTADLQLNSQNSTKLKLSMPGGDNLESSTDNGSRMGLGIGAGLNIGILPGIDIDATVKYNFLNFIGKKNDEESFNTLNVTLSLLFPIL
ncbi:MAG: outer membrane beta-barrel protein [Ignavibacteriales bacterium]